MKLGASLLHLQRLHKFTPNFSGLGGGRKGGGRGIPVHLGIVLANLVEK